MAALVVALVVPVGGLLNADTGDGRVRFFDNRSDAIGPRILGRVRFFDNRSDPIGLRILGRVEFVASGVDVVVSVV